MSPIRHREGRQPVGNPTEKTVHFSIFEKRRHLTMISGLFSSTWRFHQRKKNLLIFRMFFGKHNNNNIEVSVWLNTQISRSWSVVAAMAHQSFPPWQLYIGAAVLCSRCTSFSLFKRRILLKIHQPGTSRTDKDKAFIINLINFKVRKKKEVMGLNWSLKTFWSVRLKIF